MSIVDKTKNKAVKVSGETAPAVATVEPTAQPTEEVKPASTKKPKETDKLIKNGAVIRSQLSEEEKSVEGIWTDHVTRVRALTAQKIKERTVIGGKETFEPAIVGALFVSDIPLTGIWKESGELIDVEAGQEFVLTREEFGRFMARRELSGFCKNSRLTVRFSKNKGGFTPALIDTTGVAVKSNSINIDTLDPETQKYVCLPEYEKDFGKLYQRAKSTRTLGSGSSDQKSKEHTYNLAAGYYAYLMSKDSAAKK